VKPSDWWNAKELEHLRRLRHPDQPSDNGTPVLDALMSRRLQLKLEQLQRQQLVSR